MFALFLRKSEIGDNYEKSNLLYCDYDYCYNNSTNDNCGGVWYRN